MAEHWVTKSSNIPRAKTRKREYTKQEKLANWWDYHWYYVVGGIVGAAILISLAYSVLTQVKPDYQVALCARETLPEDTANALAEALAQYGTDQNGDGQVIVQINQYTVNFSGGDEVDAYSQMAGITKLSADMQSGSSFLYLSDDIAGFAAQEGLLAEQVDYYRWTDCPVLAGLELGQYERTSVVDAAGGDSQEYMARFALFHRGSQPDQAEADFWNALTQGAVG